jgi:HD domain
MNGYPSLDRDLAADPIAALREALSATRPEADVDLLRRAYDVAAHYHYGQFRRSGDPYVTHAVSVATILAGLGADDRTLCAVVVHAGTVYYDANGCFGETLDTAFRLLDAPSVKRTLQASQAPLVLVISAVTCRSVYPGLICPASSLVGVQVAGNRQEGFIRANLPAARYPRMHGYRGSDGTSS